MKGKEEGKDDDENFFNESSVPYTKSVKEQSMYETL